MTPIVWIDCEMTGLDINSDALVEVACVVTGSDLVPLDSGIDIIIKPPDAALETMPEVVRAMHTSSGLLEQLPDGVDLATAQRLLLDYVKTHITEPRKSPLGGSSVHVDRMFLARDMPELTEFLHYRIIDVSSIKELTRRWYPRVYYNSPQKLGGHRALADILDSIKELRYYRDTVFVAEPGPASDQAQSVAAALQAAALNNQAVTPAPLQDSAVANDGDGLSEQS